MAKSHVAAKWFSVGNLTVTGILFVYFTPVWLSKIWPGFFALPSSFLYVLSVPVVLMSLLFVGALNLLGIVFSPNQFPRAKQRRRSLLFVPLGGFAAFGAVFALARTLPPPPPIAALSAPPEPPAWQITDAAQAAKANYIPRPEMVASTVVRFSNEWTRADIEALFGPSQETDAFGITGRDLTYELGPERGFLSIDSEWLLIWLDDDGHFERYQIITN